MEEIKSANATVERKDDCYELSENGIGNFKEVDLDIVLRPTVKIPLKRYEELVKAEVTLGILGRLIEKEHPYNYGLYVTVGGNYIPSNEEGEGK